MTSDCYAILGVTPAAEDVVIGAAYRALMRHYHPDTNLDPNAQARAREITAAYAMLRDPARRAEYDARSAAGENVWFADEPLEQPPPMRAAGIGAALFALILVGAVWAWPRSGSEHRNAPPAPRHAASPTPRPADSAIGSRPESDRLSDVDQQARVLPPPVAPVTPAPEAATIAPQPQSISAPEPAGASASPSRRRAAPPVQARLRPGADKPKPVTAERAGTTAKDDRVGTLDRMSAGFFTQSMAHASDSKKALLLAERDRSVAERKACRSQSCVADVFVRQIRATGAIMESGAEPAKK